LPSEGYALVRQSSGAYVTYLKYSPDDATGNNDGIINPGETVRLPLWVRNFGSAGSDGAVACTLATSGPAALSDSLHDFGALAAGDSALNTQGFAFTVAPTCSNATVLPFVVRCHDASAGWSSSFSLTVGAPLLSYAGRAIGGGGRLDPGSQRSLAVTIRNTGLGNAYNLSGTLHCDGAGVTVTDSQAAFGTATHGGSASNGGDSFAVAVDGGCAIGDSVRFTLTVRSDGAPDLAASWYEYIGDIRYTAAGADGYYAVEDSDLVSRRPAYQWVETRGSGGTQVAPGDDGSVTVPLPFAFAWYGAGYDTATICGNGWMGLGRVPASGYYWEHQHLPTAGDSMPRPAVFAQWADLDPTAAGAWVGYRSDPAQHRFVVQFDSVPFYGTATANTFEIILYDSTGDDASGCLDFDVVCQYKRWSDISNSGIGIQDASGTRGLDVYYNGQAGASGRLLGFYSGKAVRFTRQPGAALSGVAGPVAAPALPQSYALLRNTPNPFRYRTTIVFQLPRPASVDLQIYNIAGQLVRTLVHGPQPAGTHAASWDGRDAAGQQVSSGVYLYRLSSPQYSRTGKLSLVR
ncbi:MAG TPA: FlgD immunoglobulin-like domain containing protein, partial [Candidatus Edwardsbacteria bacterium]|nr:FlgD immunoglobulin-like domain containing protein [Candidatus Edwardsbacteria bacterium]